MTATDSHLPTADTVVPLEPGAEWRGPQVADPSTHTRVFDAAQVAELEAALATAKGAREELLDITRDDFPLPTLAPVLAEAERELIEGRGFTLFRGLPVDRYEREDAERIYWGIGLHLGTPWPQNAKGHLLGDVTDQGKAADDPTSRGNEIGGVAFPYHSDGSDLVGLFCLRTGVEGGTSTVANAVAIHNELVRTEPELAAALYEPLAYDFRGEQAPGRKGWYLQPVFTRAGDRLFVRYIRPYIRAAARHDDAPRPSEAAVAAMDRVDAMCADPEFHVFMDLEPGDMQFVNNYHVLHARTAYRDDRATGRVRHLKRLWLETSVLAESEKPEAFRLDRSPDSWAARSGRTMSRLG
jgi:alpha-ketoglutarate-dependent taurine dioxygenase